MLARSFGAAPAGGGSTNPGASNGVEMATPEAVMSMVGNAGDVPAYVPPKRGF